MVKLLELTYDEVAIVRKRPNRFLGIVDIIGKETGKVKLKSINTHIHDPGRLEEILYPGNKVLLKKPDKEALKYRKTKWDIIAGWIEDQWVLIHSGYHRRLVENILKNKKINMFGSLKDIKAEVQFGDSRLDFLLIHQDGDETFVEVKGCTLTIDGRALFPDAPTERGARHIKSLIKAKRNGYGAGVIILVFRTDSECFAPNDTTDPKFAQLFRSAINAGVNVYPLVLKYENSAISFERSIPICPEIGN